MSLQGLGGGLEILGAHDVDAQGLRERPKEGRNRQSDLCFLGVGLSDADMGLQEDVSEFLKLPKFNLEEPAVLTFNSRGTVEEDMILVSTRECVAF